MGKLRLIIGIVFIAPMFVLLGVIAMIVSGLLWVLKLKNASYAAAHFILGWLVGWIYFFLGVRVKVEGKENIPRWGDRICYVPNHSSMLDIPVLFGSGMWCGIVAKKELFKVPVLHGLLKTLHCIPIDRSSLREGFKSIIQGAERIESGYPMGIFPEGTRSKTGEIAAFKPGALKMATKAKAVIVPVAIQNTRSLFEDAYTFKRIPVYVSILEPIDTAALDEEELKNLSDHVETLIREEYAKLPQVRKNDQDRESVCWV